MTQDWGALGEAVRAARLERGWSQIDLAGQAHVSVGTVKLLESGRERGRLPWTLPYVEKALGWDEGHARAVLQGHGRSEGMERRPLPMGDLPLRLVQMLREQRVVDAVVTPLSPRGGTIVAIWLTDPDTEGFDDATYAAWDEFVARLPNPAPDWTPQ